MAVRLSASHAGRPLGDHTRKILARESDSAWVPMSQTRPCVSRHAHTSVVKLIRARLVRVRLSPRKIPETHFYQMLSRTEGHSAAGKIRSINPVTSSGIETATFRLVA
jgi:hypothetical protein